MIKTSDAWDPATNYLLLCYDRQLGNQINLRALIDTRIKYNYPDNLVNINLEQDGQVLTYSEQLVTNKSVLHDLLELWSIQAKFFPTVKDPNLYIFGAVKVKKNTGNAYLYCLGTQLAITKNKPNSLTLMKAMQACEELMSLYSVDLNFDFNSFLKEKKND